MEQRAELASHTRFVDARTERAGERGWARPVPTNGDWSSGVGTRETGATGSTPQGPAGDNVAGLAEPLRARGAVVSAATMGGTARVAPQQASVELSSTGPDRRIAVTHVSRHARTASDLSVRTAPTQGGAATCCPARPQPRRPAAAAPLPATATPVGEVSTDEHRPPGPPCRGTERTTEARALLRTDEHPPDLTRRPRPANETRPAPPARAAEPLAALPVAEQLRAVRAQSPCHDGPPAAQPGRLPDFCGPATTRPPRAQRASFTLSRTSEPPTSPSPATAAAIRGLARGSCGDRGTLRLPACPVYARTSGASCTPTAPEGTPTSAECRPAPTSAAPPPRMQATTRSSCGDNSAYRWPLRASAGASALGSPAGRAAHSIVGPHPRPFLGDNPPTSPRGVREDGDNHLESQRWIGPRH